MHYGLYLSVVLLKFFLCIMMILMNWYENILKFEYIEVVINVLFAKKILKAYYGFRVLYVFPFPSAGHGPMGSGRDKVGIRAMVSLLNFKIDVLCFLTLLRY